MPNIGPLEIAIVLIIALVIFGPKRLPDLGRSAGKGLREFKDSISGNDDADDDERRRVTRASADDDAEEKVDGEVVAHRS